MTGYDLLSLRVWCHRCGSRFTISCSSGGPLFTAAVVPEPLRGGLNGRLELTLEFTASGRRIFCPGCGDDRLHMLAIRWAPARPPGRSRWLPQPLRQAVKCALAEASMLGYRVLDWLGSRTR